MLKAEQVPKEAITKMMKSVHWSSFYGEDDARELIAAALNAWPGMGPIRTDQPIGDWCDKLPAIILPLPAEVSDG